MLQKQKLVFYNIYLFSLVKDLYNNVVLYSRAAKLLWVWKVWVMRGRTQEFLKGRGGSEDVSQALGKSTTPSPKKKKIESSLPSRIRTLFAFHTNYTYGHHIQQANRPFGIM